MSRIAVLGATGRTGTCALVALPAEAEATAVLRAPSDRTRLPETASRLRSIVAPLTDAEALHRALAGADVIINAVRMRGEIPADTLVRLHETVRTASGPAALILTVGGAGSLRLPGGARLFAQPDFPTRTLPRGRAHARLRDHLEAGGDSGRWAYLIPPPNYAPDGPRTGRWRMQALGAAGPEAVVGSRADAAVRAGEAECSARAARASAEVECAAEAEFLTRSISYADFGGALAAAAVTGLTGTHLVAW